MNLKKVLGITGIVAGLTVASVQAVDEIIVDFDSSIYIKDTDFDGFPDSIDMQSIYLSNGVFETPVEEFRNGLYLKLSFDKSGEPQGYFSGRSTTWEWDSPTQDFKFKAKGGFDL